MAREGSKKCPAADTRRKSTRGRVDKSAPTSTSRAWATPHTPPPAPPAVQDGAFDQQHFVSTSNQASIRPVAAKGSFMTVV